MNTHPYPDTAATSWHAGGISAADYWGYYAVDYAPQGLHAWRTRALAEGAFVRVPTQSDVKFAGVLFEHAACAEPAEGQEQWLVRCQHFCTHDADTGG